jgi:hypothetical protein
MFVRKIPRVIECKVILLLLTWILYNYHNCTPLKGPCHEIFDLRFFSSNHSIWAPDPRAKAFLHMASNSRRYSTKKSIFWWSAVSMSPLTTGGRYQWHRWPVVGSVNDTVDQWSAVSKTQWFRWHRWPLVTASFQHIFKMVRGVLKIPIWIRLIKSFLF